jgi:hypothetical protein
MEPKKRYSGLNDRARKPLIELDASPVILDILDFLQGKILPSEYIRHAPFSTPAYIQKCLNGMSQAHLIGVPDGYDNRNARYRFRPLTVFPLGHAMLAEHGRARTYEKLGSSSFDHDYLAHVAGYSFDRAAVEISHVRKLTLARVIDYFGLDPTTTSEVPEYHIRPDLPFMGFECNRGDRKGYFYLHGIEADRATEPLRGFGRQTLESKVRNYAGYLESKHYRRRYGISNCATAWVFVNPQRAEGFLQLIKEKWPHLADRFLVKVLPDFLHYDDFPPPTAWALTEDWRTANGTLNILDKLGASNGQARASEEGAGAFRPDQEKGEGA